MNINLDETLKSAFKLFKVPFEPVSNIFYIPNKANAKYIIEFDYMTMPPEDKRHNHPPYELDLGDGEVHND